jgi:hypothetical protein
MMRTVVSSGNDALNILFEAAAAQSQEAGLNEQAEHSRGTSSHAPCGESGRSPFGQMQSIVSPNSLARAIRPIELSHAANDVLSIWESCRFVMMGWFTSREAVTLIDL